MSSKFNEGGEFSSIPTILPDVFNGVLFTDSNYMSGDAAWAVNYFEGKSNVIRFVRVGSNITLPTITQIQLRPAPTMTFLNPRPAPGSLPYPWRCDGGEHNHYIKLPLPLTYRELSQGSQIVVSGVTDSITVIEGVVEENKDIHFRAGGTLIASVLQYNGERDLVQIIVMEEFAGEILAVNFDKAYKNFQDGSEIYLDGEHDGILTYQNNGSTPFAKCILNGVVISDNPSYIPSNGLLGNLGFQSQYLESYGDVIEAYYWANGRYLYVIRMGNNFKLSAESISKTSSPLTFPVF